MAQKPFQLGNYIRLNIFYLKIRTNYIVFVNKEHNSKVAECLDKYSEIITGGSNKLEEEGVQKKNKKLIRIPPVN